MGVAVGAGVVVGGAGVKVAVGGMGVAVGRTGVNVSVGRGVFVGAGVGVAVGAGVLVGSGVAVAAGCDCDCGRAACTAIFDFGVLVGVGVGMFCARKFGWQANSSKISVRKMMNQVGLKDNRWNIIEMPPLNSGQDYSTRVWQRKLNFPLVFLALLLLLTGCAFPGSTKPVLKIGLVAPFEGTQRQNGYQRLYGVKLALQEINRAGGLAGYKFELVALNDFAQQSEAILQARELVLDSQVMGVIGEWDPQLFSAAAPVFAQANMAVINPTRFSEFSILPATFSSDYQSLGGSAPDDQARQAYLATYSLLHTIEAAAKNSAVLNRALVLKTFNGTQ